MADRARFRATLRYLTRALVEREEIGAVLYGMTDRTAEVVGCDGAGLALCDADGDLQFVTATGTRAMRIERLETEAQEGPSYEALVSGEQVSSTDLEHEDRWPAFTRIALDHDLRAVAGFPLLVDGRTIGMLDLYWSGTHRLEAEEAQLVQLLADMSAALVVNLGLIEEAETLSEQLQRALDSRVVIEQATGVLAERHGEDPAEAFGRLREHARAQGLPLREAATAVIAGRSLP